MASAGASITKVPDEREREVKKRVRIQLLTIVSSLTTEDITRIVGNESRIEALQEQIIQSIIQKFPNAQSMHIKKIIDSVQGNIIKCYEDLHDDAPPSIDMTKLEHWNARWRSEKERSKRAKFIDTQTVFSKRMRKEQVSAAAAAAEQAPTSLAELGTAEAPILVEGSSHLHRSINNYTCSFTIGIRYEDIKRGKKVGSGSYGTVHMCTVEGISFLPPENIYCAKEFKGQPKSQLKSFALESSIDINHRGIVRAIAHTRRAPWVLLFPFFNGGSLGDLMECVPAPTGTLSNVLVGQGEIAKKKASLEEIQRAKSVCTHAPTLIHALVQALAFAHGEGVIHTDLHPWNIMLDFTKEGMPRVGIIDWGLAMRVGCETRKADVMDPKEHALRPWRAHELVDLRINCPWTPASDVFALAWVIDQLCIFCFEFSNLFKTDFMSTRASFDVQSIRQIIKDGYLKIAKIERKTLNHLDADLQRLGAQPEHCLRPASEMSIAFF